LIGLGWADEVKSLGNALPGDIVQRYVLNSRNNWEGHQYVIVDVKMDLGYYKVQQYGAHAKGIGTQEVLIPVGAEFDNKHRYFIARIKPHMSGKCNK
jgi:hypothetical protein